MWRDLLDGMKEGFRQNAQREKVMTMSQGFNGFGGCLKWLEKWNHSRSKIEAPKICITFSLLFAKFWDSFITLTSLCELNKATGKLSLAEKRITVGFGGIF